ncbi:MAG TPA: amidohydrolase [Puia sp.]|jgi:predicted amidohydrolase|nr:amidohydrolase [Puia sp.]
MSTLTITTIQTDLRWEDKTANLRHFEERIFSLTGPAEIVVLPEMFSTGFSMRPEELAEKMDGPTVGWMRDVAARKKIILTGSLIVEEGGHYFNRLVWMLPNGRSGYYDKRHRFAYAGENKHYTAGGKRLVASVKGWRVLLLVCYDLRFPVWSRQNPREGEDHEYDLIIYVANWPERRSHAWKTLLQARAIENQSFVVGVNRIGADGHEVHHSGDSMIVGPLGEVVYHAAARDEAYTLTLQKDDLARVRERFPFWKDADHFSIEAQ